MGAAGSNIAVKSRDDTCLGRGPGAAAPVLLKEKKRKEKRKENRFISMSIKRVQKGLAGGVVISTMWI
jgi:hypothetical protein